MVYLLDTNACIQILNSPSSVVTQRLLTIPRQEIFLCTVVYSELYYGAFKSTKIERNLTHLEHLFEEFFVLSLTKKGAKLAGKIRSQLKFSGTPISPNDLLIASVALSNNLTLVTHNTREFGRVDSLQIEDWEI